MKKISIVLWCLALVLPSVGFSTAVTNNTIYVDDDGTAEYTTIQEALDVAKDGDTIYVYNGFYQENIVITVPVSVIGEEKVNTIIDGGGTDDVVYILSDNVTLSGFTIQNSGKKNNIGFIKNRIGGVSVRGNYTYVHDNIIQNNKGYGILLENVVKEDGEWLIWELTGNRIENNKIYGNGMDGIFQELNHFLIISNNDIQNNYVGIALGLSSNVEISNNILLDNGDYGIIESTNSEDLVVFSNIIKNQDIAIILNGGGSEVYKNHIESMDIGIKTSKISYESSDYVHHNNFINCKTPAFFIQYFFEGIWDITLNQWENNYWNDEMFHPKLIRGKMNVDPLSFPWVEIDQHPASEPYDIDLNATLQDQLTGYDVTIDGKIQCSSKPFIKCDEEHFYVTLNNSGETDVPVLVNFYIWDEDDDEYEWFEDVTCTVPASSVLDTNESIVSLLWPGSWNAEPWGWHWPGRFIPRAMKATVEYNGEILDTQENRFFMGFLIF